jgi:hypothetical protein
LCGHLHPSIHEQNLRISELDMAFTDADSGNLSISGAIAVGNLDREAQAGTEPGLHDSS